MLGRKIALVLAVAAPLGLAACDHGGRGDDQQNEQPGGAGDDAGSIIGGPTGAQSNPSVTGGTGTMGGATGADTAQRR